MGSYLFDYFDYDLANTLVKKNLNKCLNGFGPHITVTMFLTLDTCSVVQMSNLIRSRKAVTTAQISPHPAQPLAAIAPAQMDHLPVGLGVSHASASLASSVAQPVSTRRCHRTPPPPQHNRHNIDILYWCVGVITR